MDHSVHKTTVYRVVSVALLITLAILMLFPLYWIITGSVKGAKEINARVPSFFPVSPTSDNYVKLFAKPAWTWLLNTVFACGMTMLLTYMVLIWIFCFGQWALCAFATILFLMCVYRHRTNIQRLLNGTENKIGRRVKPQTDAKTK